MASEAPKQGFRLSMLIYDTRYRSMTIQVIVLILFGLFFSWLINNTAFRTWPCQGRQFNFGFLWNSGPGMTSGRR
jgi:general L-amino acid transport system permease protein